MGFLFNSKKKQSDNQNEAEAQSPVVDLHVTKKVLAESAATRKEIEDKFTDLKGRMARGEFNRKAAENQAMLEKYTAIAPDAGEDADADGEENRSPLADYIKDLLTVPGGYYEDPSETNDVPKTNLDYYAKAIRILEFKFKDIPPAAIVESGSYRLENAVGYYLDALRSALEQGNAMKANAAIDMIKYVLVVGHRFEDVRSDADRELSLQRKESVLKLGDNLIDCADGIYKEIMSYQIDEQRYAGALDSYIKKRENYDRTCPKEVQQLIERYGFKSAKDQLPVGDSRRQYLNLMLELHGDLTTVLMSSMLLEAHLRILIGLKSTNDTLVYELRKAFADNGKNVNIEEQLRVLNELVQKNIKNMDEANKYALMWANQSEETRAELNRIAEDIKIGSAIDISVNAVHDYEYIQRTNREYKEQSEQYKREYEIAKRKAQLEKEKRKVEEREQYLEDIRQMELEEERMKNMQEELDQQILIAEEEYLAKNPAETNMAEPIDNRQIITEEA